MADKGSLAEERLLTIRDLGFGRAAHLGTAAHKSYEYVLREKLGRDNEGAKSPYELAERKLVEGYDNTDDTTKEKIGDLDQGKKHLANLVVSAVEIGNVHKPIDTEGQTGYSAGGLDWAARYDGYLEGMELADVKSHGGPPKWYGSQFGGMALGMEQDGKPVRKAKQYNLKRNLNRPANITVTEYDIEAQKVLAKNTMLRMANNTEAFLNSGDPLKFTANPADPLCSPKYCPAWGTRMCPVGKGAPNNK